MHPVRHPPWSPSLFGTQVRWPCLQEPRPGQSTMAASRGGILRRGSPPMSMSWTHIGFKVFTCRSDVEKWGGVSVPNPISRHLVKSPAISSSGDSLSVSEPRPCASPTDARSAVKSCLLLFTVNSHNFDSQEFELRVSNRTSKYRVNP